MHVLLDQFEYYLDANKSPTNKQQTSLSVCACGPAFVSSYVHDMFHSPVHLEKLMLLIESVHIMPCDWHVMMEIELQPRRGIFAANCCSKFPVAVFYLSLWLAGWSVVLEPCTFPKDRVKKLEGSSFHLSNKNEEYMTTVKLASCVALRCCYSLSSSTGHLL